MNNGVIELSKESKLSFMRVIYSIFQRDNELSNAESAILKTLRTVFSLSPQDEPDYNHNLYSDLPRLAAEINEIGDDDTRGWLMYIIFDLFEKGSKNRFGFSLGSSITDEEKKQFKDLISNVHVSMNDHKKLQQLVE